MESPNRTYLPAIDHLRAFAALLIIFYHSYHLLYPRLAFHRAQQLTDWVYTKSFLLACLLEGHTAVSLFLVISGFILTYGSLGRPIFYRGFYWNRLLRLFPLFFAFLITGANAFRPQFEFGAFLTWAFQFGYLTAGPIYGVWTGVAWSISLEAHLYLLFPALRHYLDRGEWWPVLRLSLIGWVARLAAVGLGADVINLTYSTALGRIDQFFAGAVLAWILHRHGLPGRLLAMAFPLSALAAAGMLYGFHRSGGYLEHQSWRLVWPTIEALVWSAFVACYLGFANYVPRLVDRPLRFLGRISYSLYLVHIIVIWIFADKHWYFAFAGLSVSQNIFLSTFVLILPVVIPVSALTYASIEKPFLAMRWRYRVGDAKEEAVCAAAS